MILRSERIEGGRGGQSVNQNGSYLQNLTADSFHSVSQSQSHVQNHINQSKSQNLSRGQHKSHIRNQNENQTEIQSLRLNRISSSPERKTSHTSSSKDGEQRNLVSAAYNSSDSNQALPIRDRATPTTNTVSSFSKERQSELQYYINKLLDRSPGDPLESSDQEEQTVEHRQTEGHSGKSSQWESFSSECQVPVGPSSSPCQREPRLEQLATLMGQTLPAQTTQQLQQLLYSMLRSEVAGTDGPVRTNLDQKLSQLDKKEGSSSAAQRRVAGQSRSTQSVSSRGRRTGQQGQRSGPTKVNAWR
ncbi:uncharacterized protein LOC115812479 [Chanos chanos]|uniref:Uncharacterized protein LOC115812479 n=1 Tax=Chanos chanos TaxID=29144 RepID=A0A6J2VFA0_CHACN|nr:uncharacterized protein LOC115812479 [Chanos chanos]